MVDFAKPRTRRLKVEGTADANGANQNSGSLSGLLQQGRQRLRDQLRPLPFARRVGWAAAADILPEFCLRRQRPRYLQPSCSGFCKIDQRDGLPKRCVYLWVGAICGTSRRWAGNKSCEAAVGVGVDRCVWYGVRARRPSSAKLSVVGFIVTWYSRVFGLDL